LDFWADALVTPPLSNGIATSIKSIDLRAATYQGATDPEQKIQFPARATVDDVIDRMIAILQDAARK